MTVMLFRGTPRNLLLATALLLVFAGALALRLPGLGLRPMHGDEAVNAWKLNELRQTGVFVYDPAEFHGPTLFYLSLPLVWLSGAPDYAHAAEAMHRATPAVFGAGLVLLLWLVRRGLGAWETIAAAVLTALSTAMVFYSRYYIHEMLLVFFSFLALAAGWRLARSRHWGWAVVLGLALGLMHATKETAVLAWLALAAAGGLAVLWRRVMDHAPSAAPPAGIRPRSVILLAGVTAAAAVLVMVLLFSAFFQHWPGPLDAVRTFGHYLGRAAGQGPSGAGFHLHPWDYYLKLLAFHCQPQYAVVHGQRVNLIPAWSEALVLVLALAGYLAALWRKGPDDPRAGFLRLLAFYTVILTAIYCLIPYKTPWCVLSFLHGMILLAGYGAVALVRLVPWRGGEWFWPCLSGRMALGMVMAAGAANLGLQAHAASFGGRDRLGRFVPWYAHAGNPYVYAHPVVDLENLVGQLDALAAVGPRMVEHGVFVVAPRFKVWPLPWYLRRFDQARVGYYLDPSAPDLAALGPEPPGVRIPLNLRPVLVLTVREQVTGAGPASPEQAAAEGAEGEPYYLALERIMGDRYAYAGTYAMRRDAHLVLYVRSDLWAAFLATRGGPPADNPFR